MTFSRLVVRLEQSNEIVVEGGRFRVLFLEALRRHGYSAVGAESVVFDKDEGAKARFVLGGTATELRCKTQKSGSRRCALGVFWELLDQRNDRVTYRVLTRHATTGTDHERVAEELVWGTFYSLLARPAFSAALSAEAQSVKRPPAMSVVNFKRCARTDVTMPADADAVLGATVVVFAGKNLGSGAVVSPDGLVLTAAHVVEGQSAVQIQQRAGQKANARVVRIDESADVAVLRAESGSDYPCVPLRESSVKVGDDLFAIGTPLGQDLAFTLTRGVVSGLRELDGLSLVQTDASVNRGNSGGPLLDSQGRLVGIVSWKAAGAGVEGIAFGVPVAAALRALQLAPADATDTRLGEVPAARQVSPPPADDAPDPMPLLEPEPVAEKPKGPKTRTARTLSAVGWIAGGLGLAGVGVTYGLFEAKKDSLVADDFDRLRLANDASWVVVAAGAGMLLTSELLPRERVGAPTPRRTAARRSTLAAGIGLGRIALAGQF